MVSSADVDVLPEIDWNRCVICQTKKKEKLLCPNNSKQHDKHVGYKSLPEDLLSFDSIGMLPYGIKLSSLRNEGQPLLVSFIENSAKFHKSTGIVVILKEHKIDVLRKAKRKQRTLVHQTTLHYGKVLALATKVSTLLRQRVSFEK